MLVRLHFAAAIVATLTIATFLVSTVLVESFGTHAAIAHAKSLIVMPGLLVLVPALAATGASGFQLARGRTGQWVSRKQRRMPFIAANGLLVLLPCALVLDRWASAGQFGASFQAVQAVELLAGATNLVLAGLNMRDGLRLAGRLAPQMPVQR